MWVEGKERADEAAKQVAKRIGVRKCLERFTSLAHVGNTILERKLKEAKH